jgi:hypothetical protein
MRTAHTIKNRFPEATYFASTVTGRTGIVSIRPMVRDAVPDLLEAPFEG